MGPVLLDFETRSRADLKVVGGRVYWQSRTTEPICCCWHDTHDGAEGVWIVGDEWPHRGRVLGAHNMTGFDRFGCYRLGWSSPGDPWVDTSELARKAGYPGALDALGTRLLGVPKDDEGSRFTRALSSVRKPKGVKADEWKALTPEQRRANGVQPTIDLPTLERVVAYCESDVAIIRDAWPYLVDWLAVDAHVSAVERIVNDRGIAFDAPLARALLAADARNVERALEQAATALEWTVDRVRAAASSVPQFTAETGAANAKAATTKLVDHPLARAREALASITRGKLIAGLARQIGGRLYDSTRYYGGHTGRWSGQGMQLQNLPRPTKRLEGFDDDAIARLVDRAMRGDDLEADEINAALRATLIAPPGKRLVVADFSAVEARALVWAAGDEQALAVYRAGTLDPYKIMAETIFGTPYDQVSKVERTAGKIAELACGYQGGAGALEKMAAPYGFSFEAAGVDAAAVVAAWRALHRPCVSLWYACQRAFAAAIEGRATSVSCFDFAPSTDGSCVAVFLPSGRPVVYQGAQLCEGGESLAYWGSHGREHTYGGKIVENLIQAFCRDLMAEALVAAERAGLCPVLTCHDEIVCEVDQAAEAEAEAELRRAMLTLPDWAPGFPVGCSSLTGRRYRK